MSFKQIFEMAGATALEARLNRAAAARLWRRWCVPGQLVRAGLSNGIVSCALPPVDDAVKRESLLPLTGFFGIVGDGRENPEPSDVTY